ncbi:MAG: hypothetical protein LBB63_01415 [Holosporaceae bacterium]|nr:hypothetical protein [Holosporaceae bacterium]
MKKKVLAAVLTAACVCGTCFCANGLGLGTNNLNSYVAEYGKNVDNAVVLPAPGGRETMTVPAGVASAAVARAAYVSDNAVPAGSLLSGSGAENVGSARIDFCNAWRNLLDLRFRIADGTLPRAQLENEYGNAINTLCRKYADYLAGITCRPAVVVFGDRALPVAGIDRFQYGAIDVEYDAAVSSGDWGGGAPVDNIAESNQNIVGAGTWYRIPNINPVSVLAMYASFSQLLCTTEERVDIGYEGGNTPDSWVSYLTVAGFQRLCERLNVDEKSAVGQCCLGLMIMSGLCLSTAGNVRDHTERAWVDGPFPGAGEGGEAVEPESITLLDMHSGELSAFGKEICGLIKLQGSSVAAL